MIRNPKHLYSLLKIKPEELIQILKDIDSFYYKKYENKKDSDGSVLMKNGTVIRRELTPSRGTLKTIQSMIKNRILSKIDYPSYIQGGIKRRDNLSNALKHKGKKYHFVTDIRNFFPSVNIKMVYRSFSTIGCSPDVSSILTKLTTYEGHLPQGTPTSPYIANLAAMPMDGLILEFCDANKMVYTRFVDDLTFSSSFDFKHLLAELKSLITSCGFIISINKTHYKVGPVSITGITTKNNILKAPQQKIDKLKLNNLSVDSRRGLENYINRIHNSN